MSICSDAIPPEPVELPDPHDQSADREAKNKPTRILSGGHLPRVCPKIEPRLRRHVCGRVVLQLAGYEDLRPVTLRVHFSSCFSHKANV